MSKLDDLKNRAAAKREERENIYNQVVSDSVRRVLNGNEGIVALNMLSQRGASVFKDSITTDAAVAQITEAVTRSITNPVDNFLLLCKNRKFTDRRVKVVVNRVYETYFCELNRDGIIDPQEVTFEDKLEAVAMKLEMEQSLWDELPLLQKIGDSEE